MSDNTLWTIVSIIVVSAIVYMSINLYKGIQLRLEQVSYTEVYK